ncbi:hypothetical protein KFK09_006076 [Dendrobium nobile]|uniref:Uncharacterized protein n=1 Tax=Dendrobium nobile TaxID=94219 RepID=A0A8T3BQB8_DENNO|nr:hypothetical protein KFK09_006076 [Dendrobium nobile]
MGLENTAVLKLVRRYIWRLVLAPFTLFRLILLSPFVKGPRARIFKKLVVMFFPRLSLATNLPKLLRQLEHDVEAVINVLQPGPLGIIEHKFSAEEVRKAKATAEQAIKNWKRNASLENKNHFIKHATNQSPEKDNKLME